MNTELNTLLASLEMAEAQNYRNITIFPLVFPGDGALEYRMLGEALQDRALTVAEVSQGGHVPELKVINRGKTPVLVIDGEELIGAKQNRVLNTSILVKEKKSYVIEALVEPGQGAVDAGQAQERAKAFLAEAQQCEASQFPSIGYGMDVRLKKPGLLGTALVHEGRVVHTAFFRLTAEEQTSRLAPLRSRRRYWVE